MKIEQRSGSPRVRAFDGCHRAWIGALALVGAIACEDDSPTAIVAAPPSPGDYPATVDISAQTIIEGFATGTIRVSRDVAGFKITKSPITVGEFRRCFAAGACTEPSDTACKTAGGGGPLDGPNYALLTPAEAPVMCVRREQAEAYCKWFGATLPTALQWVTAARGPDVHRFAWGDQLASCDQHPRGLIDIELLLAGLALARPRCDDTATNAYAVGSHSAGRSPTGMEDVLLAPAELLRTDDNATFGGCRPPAKACFVNGLDPGAIDAVGPVSVDEHGVEESLTTAYAFRCAWSTGGAGQ